MLKINFFRKNIIFILQNIEIIESHFPIFLLKNMADLSFQVPLL